MAKFKNEEPRRRAAGFFGREEKVLRTFLILHGGGLYPAILGVGIQPPQGAGYSTPLRIKVSSILLKIETIVTLRRTYENNKNILAGSWLTEKTKILEEYLNEVNCRIIGSKLEKEIYLKKEIAKCRTLDAVHIATALKFREINDNKDVTIYTYDKMMHELAEHYKFKTNLL